MWAGERVAPEESHLHLRRPDPPMNVLTSLPEGLRIDSKADVKPLSLALSFQLRVIHPLSYVLHKAESSPPRPQEYQHLHLMFASLVPPRFSHMAGNSPSHLDLVELVLFRSSIMSNSVCQDISPSCSQHLEYSFPHTFPNEALFVPHTSLLREAFFESTMKNMSTQFYPSIAPCTFLSWHLLPILTICSLV